MKNKFGPLYIIIAAILWGTIGIYIRTINAGGIEAIRIVALRAIGATVLLFIYFMVRDRESLRIRPKDLWVFLGTGIGSMVFFNFCYFASMRRTSLAVAAALLYTAPAFVAILAWIFLKERMTKIGIAAICLAIVGCMLTSGMATAGSGIDTIGFMLGIGSGLGYALYSIFGKLAIARGYKSGTITFYTFLIAMLCTGFTLFGKSETPVVLSGKLILAVAGLVVFSTILAYLLYTKGLSMVPAGLAAVLASIEPVVATCVSVLVFKEAISWDICLGIICILASTLVVSRQR